MLCSQCAGNLHDAEGLLPEHTSSQGSASEAWLVDRWGNAHALGDKRTIVGRRDDADIVVLHRSVSREHAELSHRKGRWQLRDLGSRNGLFVDESPVQGKVRLQPGARLRFGEVEFFFLTGALHAATWSTISVDTAHVGGSGPMRYIFKQDDTELCILGSGGAVPQESGGAILFREVGASSWSEASLPRLEFQLLRVLSVRALEEADSPAHSRGCVATKELAKTLPFQSDYANEENVRQVVRRVRGTLKKLGVEKLVESVPGRGYYLAWPIDLSA